MSINEVEITDINSTEELCVDILINTDMSMSEIIVSLNFSYLFSSLPSSE